uniref:Uncharacterized protein n=1 Tax=Salix viminalis TaxID=40686 RepID=A0A6N2MN93_SALVM
MMKPLRKHLDYTKARVYYLTPPSLKSLQLSKTKIMSYISCLLSSSVLVKGALKLLVVMAILSKCVSLQQSFIMIDRTLTYNDILAQPLLH